MAEQVECARSSAQVRCSHFLVSLVCVWSKGVRKAVGIHRGVQANMAGWRAAVLPPTDAAESEDRLSP